MQMVMLVVDDPALMDDVLDAWHAVGIRDATIVESTGFHRRRAQTLGARYPFGFPRVVERVEEGHYTLFVLVSDVAKVPVCVAAAESVLGDLSNPHTGVIAAWELSFCKGASTPHEEQESLE